MSSQFRKHAIMAIYSFCFFSICELPILLGKDNCFIHRLKFSVFLPFKWLLSKARQPNRPSSLKNLLGENVLINVLPNSISSKVKQRSELGIWTHLSILLYALASIILPGFPIRGIIFFFFLEDFLKEHTSVVHISLCELNSIKFW